MQTWASVEHGYWYARSPEFLQTGAMETLRWLRVVGDTIFAAGAMALALFVIGLRTGGSAGRQPFRRYFGWNRSETGHSRAAERRAVMRRGRLPRGELKFLQL